MTMSTMKRPLSASDQVITTNRLESSGVTPLPAQAGDMTGHSDAMRALIARVKRVADSPMNTLILGETGSGKELCAETLHKLSARGDKPWVAVNCAALPPSILMAELFGCQRGAFTNAERRLGLIQSAHGGTLFLDEVGELSLEAQAALLRAIDRGEVRPLGSDRSYQVSVRIICATHRDLLSLIKRGEFRADLYHRLSTVTLVIPALRQRTCELPMIAAQLMPCVVPRLTESAWNALREYPWPGNIRELKNLLTRLKHERPHGLITASEIELEPRYVLHDGSSNDTGHMMSALTTSNPDTHQNQDAGEEQVITPRDDKYLISGPPAAATQPPAPQPPTDPPTHPPTHPPTEPPSTNPSGGLSFSGPMDYESYSDLHLTDHPMSHHTTSEPQETMERALDGLHGARELDRLFTLLPTQSLEALKHLYIGHIVRRCKGNISYAARTLQISRGQIYRSLELLREAQGQSQIGRAA